MKLIPLSKNGKNKGKYFAKVDNEDYEYLNQFNWHAKIEDGNVYANRSFKTSEGLIEHIKMHREILGLRRGDKRQGDHINHDGLDNRKNNLRIVSPMKNRWNSLQKKNVKTKYIGVSMRRRKLVGCIKVRYAATVVANKIKYRLGEFKTPQEAAIAYDKKALELKGEFAVLNF